MAGEKINYKVASIFYTVSSIFNKGIAFFTVPIFTRILSEVDYGIVSTYTAWVSMLTVFISMTLYMALRQVFVEDPESLDEYHSTIDYFVSIIAGLMVLFCVIIRTFVVFDILLVLLAIVHSYASALIENYSMCLMMRYRYKLRTLYMMLPNLLSVLISIYVTIYIVKEKMYLGRIVPSAVVTMFFGIAVLYNVFKKSRTFNIDYLKYSLNISAPLIAHGIGLTILAQSDRTMITDLVGADKTAIYSVVYNLSMIATALTTAFSGIWTPWYLNRMKSHTISDFKEMKNMSRLYVIFMTMVMCCVILVGPEILKFFAAEPYWEGVSIIPPIVLANLIIFIYTFYADIEHYYKKTKIIAVNTIVAAVINIILNYFLIPVFGYEVAAYTTLFSYIISLVFHYISAKKLEPEIMNLTNYISEILLVIIITLVYYVALQSWIIRWGIAVGLCMSVLAYLYCKLKQFDKI